MKTNHIQAFSAANLVVMALFMSLVASAESASGTCGDALTWILDEDGLLTISGTGEMARGAPWGRLVHKAIIEPGVTSIGDSAFAYTELRSITIPESVASIGDSAFMETWLESVTIPSSVTQIKSDAFYHCTGLTSVTFLSNDVTIHPDAFDECGSELVFYGNTGSSAQSYAQDNGISFVSNSDILVTLHPNGGIGETKTERIAPGESFYLRTAKDYGFTRDGMTTICWEDDKGTKYEPETQLTNLTENLDLYVSWVQDITIFKGYYLDDAFVEKGTVHHTFNGSRYIADGYDLRVSTPDGTLPSSTQALEDASKWEISADQGLTWETMSGSGSSFYVTAYPPSSTEYLIRYKGLSPYYTVVFYYIDSNGSQSSANQIVRKGSASPWVPNLADGYIWDSDEYLNVTRSGIVIYAVKRITVHYDANGGNGVMEDLYAAEGVSAELSTNSFLRPCYSFAGWNTEADGSGDSYSDGASTGFLEDTTLYAQWILEGHAWQAPTYAWSDDNTSVTATRVCAHDASHVETETVSVTSQVTKAATCEEAGETTYTAVFEDSAFEAQSRTRADIAAKGHQAVALPGRLPTADAPGLTTGSRCAVCRETLIAQEVLTNVATLSLPSALRAIMPYAFRGTSAQQIDLPEGMTEIGQLAFAYAEKLTFLRIPASLAFVAEDAFEGCGPITVFAPAEKAALFEGVKTEYGIVIVSE